MLRLNSASHQKASGGARNRTSHRSVPRKRRTENKGYPTGWHWHRGALYYWVPANVRNKWDGKRHFRLGSNEYEAYQQWAKRVENPEVPVTFDKGFDKYLLTVLPKLSPHTQEQYKAAIKKLRPVFGKMVIVDFRSYHAYQYRNQRGEKHPTSANHETEFLSTFFTVCFEWGVPLEGHPMIKGQFRKLPRPGRDRVVEEWEIAEAMSLKPSKYGISAIPMIQAYILVKTTTGRRRIEILRLKTSDLLENGVRWTLAKRKQTGVKNLITKWKPGLRAAIDAALAARPIGKKRSRKHYRQPADISPWVFCKADGTPYLKDDGTESDAFGSAWGRFLDNLLANTKVKERFTDSDLRAKAANDAESLEHARRLLAHTTNTTTLKHYRRLPDEVDPVR
jgi:hypothetical protein